MDKKKGGIVNLLGMLLVFHALHLCVFYFSIKDFQIDGLLSIISLLFDTSRVVVIIVLSHISAIVVFSLVAFYLARKFIGLDFEETKYSVFLSGAIYFPFLFIPFTYVYYLVLVGSVNNIPIFSTILFLVGSLMVVSNMDLVE